MLKLEIGAGAKPQPGYIHHDIRLLDDIEIVCDARSFPKGEKNKYDEVYASNILEHFSRFEIDSTLKEWISLLKPNGLLKIIVPDIREIMRQYIEGFIDHSFMVYLVYGGQDYEFNKHHYGFDLDSLCQLFIRNNLKIVSASGGIQWEKRKLDKYCPMIVIVGQKIIF